MSPFWTGFALGCWVGATSLFAFVLLPTLVEDWRQRRQRKEHLFFQQGAANDGEEQP